MKYYSIREMAKILDVSTQNIARKIKTRKIKSKKWDTKTRCSLYSEKQFEEIKENLTPGRKKCID